MTLSFSLLASDWLIWFLVLTTIGAFIYFRRVPYLREIWQRLTNNRMGMVAATILAFCVAIALLDSVHFQMQRSGDYQVTQTVSALDLLFSGLKDKREKTYSAPFATHLNNRSIIINNAGKEVMDYAPLRYSQLENRATDITQRIILALIIGMVIFLALSSFIATRLAKKNHQKFWHQFRQILQGKTAIAWREILITFGVLSTLTIGAALLILHYHVLGTNKVGSDVFFEATKGIRTAVLIGTLTTIFMLPLALILGMAAGFFGGWIDDVIQYLYTTLSSIPGVLLISATILVMQVYINRHPMWFPNLASRADARLIALCLILGITSWSNLCRLLRAETLKLRELEFIQAARVMGVNRFVTLFRHILPNVMHIVLITIILDFSTLVLAEAVLSYVGVGVDPTTASWGNMINASRLEMARDPVVWWPLVSAMAFMLVLVLSANLLSDALCNALNPRTRN